MAGRGQAAGVRDGYQRGELARPATPRQWDLLAAHVTAGGSVAGAARLAGIQPSTVKRHLADLRARSPDAEAAWAAGQELELTAAVELALQALE